MKKCCLLCVCEREKERVGSVCVCVCERERERDRQRERESERERVCVCVFTLCLYTMQEVLTQLTSRLASQLNDLTIQVVKDDWSFPRPSHVSSSPITGAYNPRIALSPATSPSPPQVYTSHTPSSQPQSVGGVGQVKGQTSMHSPRVTMTTHHHQH